MANLKSYSCPKCGSFLDVDRDQDTYTCPFCGSVYDVVDFHGKELFDQAAELMRRKEFKKAREKYEYILARKPKEFEFLYAYACAVGEVDTLDDFDFPKRLNSKLVNLFKNDPRYLSCPGAEYFAKLLEMFNTASEIFKLKADRKKLVNEAESGIEMIRQEQKFGSSGPGIYAAIHYFVGAVIIACIGDIYKWGELLAVCLMLFYVGFPIVLFMIKYLVFSVEQGKKAEEYKSRLEPFNDMKNRARDLENEIERLEKMYEHYYKELPRLKPKASEILAPVPVNRDPKKSEVTADPKRAVICKKCGAELTLDKERKLYTCSHCGMNYDYSTFIGDELTKANTHLKNREFEMADKWFAKTLANDPGDFDANRGRILCAGKWIGFLEVRLNEKLQDVDWPGVYDALDDALNNSNDFNRTYFNKLKNLLDNVKEYYDTCVEMEGDGANVDLPALIEKREELAFQYNQLFRSFIEKDKRHRIVKSNDITNAADKVLAYRMRIIADTLWVTIEDADPDVPFAPGKKYSLLTMIKEAKGVAKDEYYDYFELFEKFIDEFVSYSLFHMKYKHLKDKEEELDLKNNTDDWSKLESMIKQYDDEAEWRKKQFDDLHKELVELDKKLFFAKEQSAGEGMENGRT